jgi:recombination protein RecR
LAFPEPLERLIRALEKFPGVGARSAERMALHVLRSPREEVAELAVALRDARIETMRCEQCGNVALKQRCPICADDERDQSVVCVVEGPREVEKMESAGVFTGTYHVLLEYLHGEILAEAFRGRRACAADGGPIEASGGPEA